MIAKRNVSQWLCILTLIVFTACSGSTAEDAGVTTNNSSQTLPATTATTDTGKSVWNDVKSAPAPNLPTTNPGSSMGVTAAANPAHGQPNHRCDIPVGAPLNSPVQQTPQAQPPLQRQQAQPPLQTLPAPAAQGSARLNPAHGQPGHDCAVPVGQPLKSV